MFIFLARRCGIFTSIRTFLLVQNCYVMMKKQFLSVRALASKSTESLGKQKMCRTCDKPATKEALFDVGNGISVLERYCEPCMGVMLKEIGSVA